MNWIDRLERLQRKHRRLAIRHNLRGFRLRQKAAGIRRIDVALSANQYNRLLDLARPDETISRTVARLLDTFPETRINDDANAKSIS